MPRQTAPRWYPRRNCWRARFPNKEYYAPKTIGEKDIGEAWRWFLECKASHVSKGKVDHEVVLLSIEPTFAEVATAYVCDAKCRVEKGEITDVARRLELYLLRCICREDGLKETPVSLITAEQVHAFIDKIAEKGRKANQRLELLAVIKAVLHWAARPEPRRDPERLVAANPIRGISQLRYEEFNAEELAAAAEAIQKARRQLNRLER